ncbi:trans-sialidase, partial [Trypanosoma conorhini]
TTPVYSAAREGGGEGEKKGRLHLWLTDARRIYDVGPISAEAEDAAASTLLYAAPQGEEKGAGMLYGSYEVAAAAEGKRSVVFVELAAELGKIKAALATWEAADKRVAESYGCKEGTCPATVEDGADDNAPATGPVGFLSKLSADGKQWEDAYGCVDAAVHGTVETTANGLRFKGAAAGAEWPVGGQGQNQRYHFANTAFTLVAKVTIHAEPAKGGSPAPLLGAKLNDGDNTVLLGLSCTKEKRWAVIFNNKSLELSKDEEWEEEKTYRVALGMNDGEGLVVYVGGSRVYDSEDDDGEESDVSKQLQELLKSRSISHFYFGRGAAGGVEVTVADVLLYSRALSEAELAALTTNPDAADAAAAAAAAGEEEAVEVPGPGVAPPGTEVKVAPAPSAGDSHPSPSEEQHQQEEEVPKEGEEKEEAATQLTQEEGREAGEASTPSNNTHNSDAEEAEEAEDEKEKEEEKKTEGNGGALAPPPLAAPAAAGAPRTGATERAVDAETSERQRGPSPPADGAATADPVGDAPPRSGPMDDGQAQQGTPSHAPEVVGGVPSASAAPTGETPNAVAEENGADPQTAAGADGGHEAPSNAATAPTAQAPGQPGSPPTRDAAPHLSNNSAAFRNTTGLFQLNTESDVAVRGCVSWLTLLTLLALCGVAAGF